MSTTIAAMRQYASLMTTDAFEGVGQVRHSVKGAIGVDRTGEFDNCGGPPSRVKHNGPKWVSKDAAQERGLCLHDRFEMVPTRRGAEIGDGCKSAIQTLDADQFERQVLGAVALGVRRREGHDRVVDRGEFRSVRSPVGKPLGGVDRSLEKVRPEQLLPLSIAGDSV